MGQVSTPSPAAAADARSRRAGSLALVLGLMALAATAFTWVLSLSDDVNPPNGIRVAGLVWLPIGFFGAPLAFMAARRGPGRRHGLLGLATAGLGLVAFVVLLFVAG